MRVPVFFVLLGLASSACERGREADTGYLADAVWRRLLAEEAQSQIAVRLDARTAAEHEQNTALVRAHIPEGYPEPYLPYGRLGEPSIDLTLAVAPFSNRGIVELGEKLFFDERLSFSAHRASFGGMSCASCHEKSRYFTDARPTSTGIDGAATPRNSPTLLNVAYSSTLTWANPEFPVLEMQARIPLFGDDPIEMGLRGKEVEVLEHLFSDDPDYAERIRSVFGLDYPYDLRARRIDYNIVTAALAAYERSLIDFDTRFDRFLGGRLAPEEALSGHEKLGIELFYGLRPLASGESLRCAQCHAGIMLTNSFQYVRDGVYYNRKSFHNTGMYNLDGRGAYPEKNHGFANAEQLAAKPELMGRFRVPPLRFVAKTAPYGHDGSLPTLEAVVRHYAAGGKAGESEYGPSPLVDPLVRDGFAIEDDELQALVSFLELLD